MRVVLAAAAEHLDRALELALAADQRVDAARPGFRHEVGGVRLERALLRCRLGLALFFADRLAARSRARAESAISFTPGTMPCETYCLRSNWVTPAFLSRYTAKDSGSSNISIEHGGAVDDLLLAAHHVDGGALQHALDAQGLLRRDLDALGQLLDLFGRGTSRAACAACAGRRRTRSARGPCDGRPPATSSRCSSVTYS